MEDICNNECTKKRNISKIILSIVYAIMFVTLLVAFVAYYYISRTKDETADTLKPLNDTLKAWHINDKTLPMVMAIFIFAFILIVGSLIGYIKIGSFVIGAGIGRYIVATTIACLASICCNLGKATDGTIALKCNLGEATVKKEGVDEVKEIVVKKLTYKDNISGKYIEVDNNRIQVVSYNAIKNMTGALTQAGFIAFFTCVGLMGGYYLYKQIQIEWKKILKITLLNLAICTGLILVLFIIGAIYCKIKGADETKKTTIRNLILAVSNGSLMSALKVGENNIGNTFGSLLAPIGALGFLTVCSIVFANMQRIIKSRQYNNNDVRQEQQSFKIDAAGISIFMLSAAIGMAFGQLGKQLLAGTQEKTYYVHITFGAKMCVVIATSIASIIGIICNISLLPQNSTLGIIKQLAAAMFLSGAGLGYYNHVTNFKVNEINDVAHDVFSITTENTFCKYFAFTLYMIILIAFGFAIAMLPMLLSIKLCGQDEAYEAFIVKSEQEKTCSLWGMHTYLVIMNVLGSILCVNLVTALTHKMFV